MRFLPFDCICGCRTILQQPDGLYRLGGGDGGDQLEPHEPLIPDLFQALEDPGLADLPGTGLVAAGRICHVDVAELVAVSADVVAEAPLIELHVVDVV